MTKHLAAAALLTACLASSAMAQTRNQPPAPGGQSTTNCTDVQVGSAESYNCINAQLGNLARGTTRFSSDVDAPISATSPSNQVGSFNEAATRSRLGPNFGKSATPYRPANNPPPAFPPR